ncbi:MAG TPA: 1,2-phenylacetyl-CoA epoxidase subunit PaaD, partial [Aeromicrobium sp.]|nr:1,2-phenylacetyl-CoA epoxidase subunit PaaD [Aeromicrobium sp.]
MVTAAPSTDLAAARRIAGSVADPEIPVITIEDLGVLRDVTIDSDGVVHASITPTYSGCPAMDAIRDDIVTALRTAGFEEVNVTTVLSPAWSTAWMSENGKQKLHRYGIAPPLAGRKGDPVPLSLSMRCPQCGSPDTRELSRFGSTACKSLRQ